MNDVPFAAQANEPAPALWMHRTEASSIDYHVKDHFFVLVKTNKSSWVQGIVLFPVSYASILL